MFTWYGGKHYITPWILENFPKSHTYGAYVEAYGGSGKTLLRKSPSQVEVFNELNSNVVNVWRVAQERGAELVRELWKIPEGRNSFERYRDAGVNCEPLKNAVREIVIRQMSFNGCQKHFSPDHVKPGKWKRNANGWMNLICRYRDEYIPRIQGVKIHNEDALNVMRQYDSDNTLLYLDPPYVHESRTISHRDDYEFEYSDADHIRMCETIRELKGYVCLSGYRNWIYDYYLKDWRTVDKEFKNRAGQWADGAVSTRRTETLWMNY